MLGMGFEFDRSCLVVCKELERASGYNEIENRFELLELLRTLNANERYLVAKFFCKMTWNVGSLRVLAVLQELRILTATEFILSLENGEQIQLILNDFLETEYGLLASLFTTAHFDSNISVKLNLILEECLERLFRDLLENSKLNDLNYLNGLKALLPAEIMASILQKHVDAVLKLHRSNVKEAFRYFSSWINEGVDVLQFTKDLCKMLVTHNAEEHLAYLLKLSSADHFNEWKYYLILLQTIVSQSAEVAAPYLKKYLKSRLRHCATMRCKQSMLHLLLTARSASAMTADIGKNLNVYADWYKQQIGEMKFVLNSEEFRNILTLLEQCLPYELELDYLEIHATISISPPVLCGKLVQAYKRKCKQHLALLKKGEEPVNESIVIEDSN